MTSDRKRHADFEYTGYIVARFGGDDDVESTKCLSLENALKSKTGEVEHGAHVFRDKTPQELRELAGEISKAPDVYLVMIVKATRSGFKSPAVVSSLPEDLDVEAGGLDTPIADLIRRSLGKIEARIKKDRHDKMMADRAAYQAELKKKEAGS